MRFVVVVFGVVGLVIVGDVVVRVEVEILVPIVVESAVALVLVRHGVVLVGLV